MRVVDVKQVLSKEELVLSGRVSDLPAGMPDYDLWFRVPARLVDKVIHPGDPFLATLLNCAMAAQQPLTIDADVSARLMAGCEQIMKIKAKWHRDYRPVSLEARVVNGEPLGARGIGCFFTGGVDSFFTLLKNRQSPEPHITHLIFVRGIDVRLDDTELYRSVTRHLEQIATELRLELVHASTNSVALSNWFATLSVHQLGGALAAVALCLAGSMRKVYIPASHTFADSYPWGSHPLVDPLWSNEEMEIVHDGCEASRVQKVAWQIAQSHLALDHLRVCWMNAYKDNYNCGQCEKCLRTMINLAAAGALTRCKTFPHSVRPEQVRSIVVESESTESFVLENLSALRKNDIAPELQAALEDVLKHYKSRRPAWRKKLRVVDEELLGGVLHKVRAAIKSRRSKGAGVLGSK